MGGLDLAILLFFNRAVAQSESTFIAAMQLSDRLPWILAACAVVGMWVAGGRAAATPKPGADQQGQQRVILLFVSMVVAFVFARGMQALVERTRPLVDAPMIVPLSPEAWQEVQRNLSVYGSFPSDHAVLFFLLTIGMFTFSRLAGVVTLVLSIFFSVLRVGVGFHWPSDVVAGALIGIAAAVFSLTLLLPLIRPVLDLVVVQARRAPEIANALGFLVVLEFSQKFSNLFSLLYQALGNVVRH